MRATTAFGLAPSRAWPAPTVGARHARDSGVRVGTVAGMARLYVHSRQVKKGLPGVEGLWPLLTASSTDCGRCRPTSSPRAPIRNLSATTDNSRKPAPR